MTKIVFTTIEQIQAHQFVGNHFSDRQAFEAIDRFVMNERNSIADRAEALRVITDKGMGCGREECMSDHELVAAHIGALSA